jgi:hypothetical protein
MATVTPNFNWPVPTSTDLVKDGATAIEALGDSIDASLVDLKGGTTGQVLSKNSNTDMDFVWVTDAAGDITGVTAGTGISGGGTSGTVTVTNSMATAIDAKGDLVPGTGADTFARLAVGANGTVLTADSAEATGLKWAAAAGGGKILQVVQGTTTTSTTIASTTYTDTTLTATITPSAATSKILCLVSQNFQNQRSSGAADGGSSIKLVRGATDIVTRGAQEVDLLYNINAVASTQTNFSMVTNIMYVDSPSTTSATTYKTQGSVRFTANSNQVTYQTSSSQSQIILLEIGA